MRPVDETVFTEHSSRVQQHLESFYGIRIVTRDIPDPLTGDLDGAEIHLDYAVNPEERFFLLAHLFGHTVQWNLDPRAFEIGQPRVPPIDEKMLPAIAEYEREAASYALWMLHQIGITDVDQWFCDYTACDSKYLLHFYRTGEKRQFKSFWLDHSEPVAPKPVLPFTPLKRTFRIDGIVI